MSLPYFLSAFRFAFGSFVLLLTLTILFHPAVAPNPQLIPHLVGASPVKQQALSAFSLGLSPLNEPKCTGEVDKPAILA